MPNTQIDYILSHHVPQITKIAIEPGAITQLTDVIQSLAPNCKPLIVCDQNTYEAAAKQAQHQINCDIHIFDNGIKASFEHVATLQELIKNNHYNLLVAVGSGTLNDLCKYSSFTQSIPYVVIGTAPSMNGYASANASLEEDGIKSSYAAHLPKAILLDLDILNSAPTRLIQAGFGDSICRSTTQADWLLSHLATNSAYDSRPFQWLANSESTMLERANGLLKRDSIAMQALVENLIISGLGMTLAGGSMPASQGEHMIAHYIDMVASYDVYHGEAIAITTLYMSQLQQKLLSKNSVKLQDLSQEKLEKLPSFLHNSAKKVAHEKTECYQKAHSTLTQSWPSIKKEIMTVTATPSTIINALISLEIDIKNNPLYNNINLFNKACSLAYLTRNRFTFLDLL